MILNDTNKDLQILDVGCGTGNITTKLLDSGFRNITCLDISQNMMQELRKKVKSYDHDINFIVSDIDTFLVRRNLKFDIIIMNSVLHHLPEYINSLTYMKEMINKKGCICIMHEPLPPQKPSLLVSFLLKLDFLAYIIRYITFIALGKLKYLKRDCRYSDYHTGKKAINLSDLKKLFDDNWSIKVNKYATAKFGITAFLLNKLGFFSSFQLIATKRL